jgi:hypothetical protein
MIAAVAQYLQHLDSRVRIETDPDRAIGGPLTYEGILLKPMTSRAEQGIVGNLHCARINQPHATKYLTSGIVEVISLAPDRRVTRSWATASFEVSPGAGHILPGCPGSW